MAAPGATAPIVVVGGGTAGCTVVSHLAARTTRDIVLIEPGPVSSMDDTPGFFDVLAQAGLVRAHQTTVGPGGGVRAYMEGRALGGGSAVNGMVLSGEAPPELEGLTRMARRDEVGDIGAALIAAGGEPVRLWWNGGRWNPGRAVAHLVEEGRISRVLDEAVSLEVRGDMVAVHTGCDEIVASQVVMCAGAIATPLLLLASGLASDVPGIGAGLQTHPMITLALRRARPLTPDPAGFDAAAVLRGLTGNGRAFLMVAYERASRAEPDLGLLSVMVMDVESRGSVQLVGGRPEVDFNCLATPGDRRAMVSATRSLAAAAATAVRTGAATGVGVDDTGTPAAALDTMDDDELGAWVVARVEPAFHATSTCAGSVDASGRLRGAPGVWVADASVLERVPACTPAAPVTMEARRIARCIEDVVAATAG